MSQEKMDLFLATTTFRRNLLQLVAPGGGQRMSARSTKEREGDDLIRKVGAVETFMLPTNFLTSIYSRFDICIFQATNTIFYLGIIHKNLNY